MAEPTRADQGPNKPEQRSRCSHVSPNGLQCVFQANEGFQHCTKHGGHVPLNEAVKPVFMLNEGRGRHKAYVFKGQSLQQAFERHLANPQPFSLAEELALARTMLECAVRQVDALSPEEMKPVDSRSISGLVAQVGEVAEQFHKLEKSLQVVVTADQMQWVVEQFAEVMLRFVPAEKQAEAIDALFSVSLPGKEQPQVEYRREKEQQ